jgi:DUF1009 family protein
LSLSSHDVIGLIAGQGRLPLLVARGMRSTGLTICCVGLRDQFDPALPAMCDRFDTASMVQPGRWIRLLRRWGVDEATIVGGVAKTRMHQPWRLLRNLPDLRAIDLWYRRLRHDRRNAAVLRAVMDDLSRSGIRLIDSTTYIPDHLAVEGVMTRARPGSQQRADVRFGWPILRKLADLEVGQSIAVRDRDVIAVEALEGTERMIERAGELCRTRGWTLLKTASTSHDMRCDVPTVGVRTIEQLRAAGGRCMALGAGRVILIDKPSVLEAADRAGIAIVGMGEEGTEGLRD